MNIKIIYDNETYSSLTPSHGFSCIIEVGKDYLMFDTGWNGEILLSNMKKMNLKPDRIRYLVLSHFHWDHIGGVDCLLKYCTPKIFLLNSFSLNFRKELSKLAEIEEIKNSKEILPGIYSTGNLKSGNNIPEQSLVIKTEENILLVTGCAHPGLQRIVNTARDILPPNYVMGGFHGFNNFSIVNKIDKIIPLHCTKYKKEILSRFPRKTIKAGAGTELFIP